MNKNDEILESILATLPADEVAQMRAEAKEAAEKDDFSAESRSLADMMLRQMEQDQEN